LLYKWLSFKGPIAQLFGRKIALIVYGIPMVFGWFLLFIARSGTLVMIGRIITGLCAGLISGTAPSYVVEISTDNVRGLLGTSFQVHIHELFVYQNTPVIKTYFRN